MPAPLEFRPAVLSFTLARAAATLKPILEALDQEIEDAVDAWVIARRFAPDGDRPSDTEAPERAA